MHKQTRQMQNVVKSLKWRSWGLSLFCSGVTFFYFFKDFIYLFPERGKGGEKERERNINVWLPLVHPQLGT